MQPKVTSVLILLVMQNFSIEIEKVNNIVNNFVEKLYGHYPVGRDKLYQFTMAILCKAKGECRFLLNIIEEFKIYNIDFELIENIIEDIRETKKARQLFFVDVLEDNSEMMYIADSLSLLQQHLRTCFQHNIYFVPLQSELIPNNMKLYYGHVDMGVHVIIYKL